MILLDTHVWIWWVQGDRRLQPNVVQWLDGQPPGSVGVSAISFWEGALLVRRGRLQLPDPAETWLSNAAKDPRLITLPLTAAAAAQAALLPDIHRDPADRFLIGQALSHACALVAEDEKIHGYQQVTCLYPLQLLTHSSG